MATQRDSDGWIEWTGGECPVGARAWVHVRLKGGEESTDIARSYQWQHNRDGYPVTDDITAYRVVRS